MAAAPHIPHGGHLQHSERHSGEQSAAQHSRPKVSAQTVVFAGTGEYWTIGFESAHFSLKDAKGLGYIQRLLRDPGHEFHALDLLTENGTAADASGTGEVVSSRPDPSALTVRAPGDAGEMLDPRAKQEYRNRLRELHEQFEELRDRGDEEAAANVESEIEFLTREIARAVGLGGRDRRAGAAAERARLNVTRAIKATIEKIADRDARLADILTRSIRTGTFCSFVPDPQVSIVWRFSLGSDEPPPATEFQLRPTGIRWVLENNRFVGRTSEDSVLRRNLELARQGRGRIVTIGGEAGVGKTRLSRELCERATREGFLAVAGSCSEHEDAVPFLPFVEILESALSQTASADGFRRALGSNAGEIARLMPQLRNMFPDIPPPLETTPEQSRRILFNSVADLIGRVTARVSLLLLIEDLHWADEGSLSLLEHLARSISALPAMILVNYRDAASDSSEALTASLYRLSRVAQVEHIKLKSLPEPEVGQMIEAMNDTPPPPGIIAAIYSVTEGNPLFVREVYQHLRERGRLSDTSGRYFTELKLDQIGIPERVKSLMGIRLSRLSSETRTVLASAAIIGASFSFDLLQAICELAPDRLLDHLEQAEHIGILTSALENREARFHFLHELIRQSVLGELSAPRRQQLHLAAADAIEKIFPNAVDHHAIDLAHHLWQAGTLAEPQRAIKYLAIGARMAKMQSAYQSAFLYLKNALELISSMPPTRERSCLELELLIAYGVTSFTTKGWWVPEVGAAYNRARALCEELGQESALFFVFFGLWSFHLVRGDHSKAYEFAMELRRLAPRANDDSNIAAIAGWAVGASQFFMGNLAEAHATFDETIRNYNRERDRGLVLQFAQDPCVCCLCFDAMALWMMGDTELAEQRAAQSLQLARAVGDRFVLVWCLTMVTKYKVMRRDFEGVDSLIDEGLAIAEENGYEYYRISMHAYRLTKNLEQRKLEDLSKRNTMYSRHNYLAKPWVYGVIAEALGNSGQVDEGLALIKQALDTSDLTSERYVESETYRIRAGLRLRRLELVNDPTGPAAARLAAEQDFRIAIEIAQKRGAKMLELRAALDLARLLTGSGKSGEAVSILNELYAEFVESADAPDLVRAREALSLASPVASH